MEKAKISGYQLFVLIFLFEIGSALLVPLAGEAKQDAWLVILIAMIGGFLLFFIYYGLFQYYPDQLLTEYVRHIMGNFLGQDLSFSIHPLFHVSCSKGAEGFRRDAAYICLSSYSVIFCERCIHFSRGVYSS